MNRQEQIDSFTMAFHRRAVARLRDCKELLPQAEATLRRWRAQRGPTASDPYLQRWDELLKGGPDAIENGVCVEGDEAATLRNMSPLGFVLSPAERAELLRASRS